MVGGTTRNFTDGNQDLFNGPTELALARYNPDGTLDTSFGTGGLVTMSIVSSGPGDIAFQSDGKIITAELLETGPLDVALSRFNANGTLDTTFGSGGVAVYPELDTEEPVAGVAVLGNGTIVVSQSNGNLLGLNSDGSLDTAFGSGGMVNTGVSITGGLLAGPNGELLVGFDDGISLYNVDGNLDTTFGTGGTITPQVIPGTVGGLEITNANGSRGPETVPASSQEVTSLALQPDGDILAAGQYSSFAVMTNQFGNQVIGVSAAGCFVARYSPSGVLDTTFGSGGFATAETGVGPAATPLSPESISVLSNNEIEVASTIGNNSIHPRSFRAHRGLRRNLRDRRRRDQHHTEPQLRACAILVLSPCPTAVPSRPSTILHRAIRSALGAPSVTSRKTSR